MQLPVTKRAQGRPRQLSPEIRTTVITSDYHLPELDTASYRAVLHFIADRRPDFHFINGDLLDMHDQSSFLKDPELSNRTEESIEMANQVLDELYDASPTTITRLLWGNHEARLTRRLFDNPDILPFVTKGKTPDQLLADALSLEDREIEWYSYPHVYNHWGFAITHGEYANLHAAKKQLESLGVSGTSGHIHRHRTWERRDRNGVRAWYSTGCLCKPQASYRPNADWVNGFGYLEQVVGRDLFTFHQIPIIKGQFIFGGVLYDQDGAHQP